VGTGFSVGLSASHTGGNQYEVLNSIISTRECVAPVGYNSKQRGDRGNSFVWDQNSCANSIGSIVIYYGKAILTRDSVICYALSVI
jgi:hypothetical protein